MQDKLQIPSLGQLDEIRETGFRPEVVGCYLHGRKVLFVYKKAHSLWQFPQGGIDNGENVLTALFRETAEELGPSFASACSDNPSFFYEDRISFSTGKQTARDLKNDKGEDIAMKGKRYFFLSLDSDPDSLNALESEFDDFRWLAFTESLALCQSVYQKRKQTMMVGAIKKLHALGLL